MTPKDKIPSWMLQSENYSPPVGKDSFIDKSILALLALLSKIRAGDTPAQKKFSVSAVIKLPLTLIFALAVSLARGTAFLSVAGTLLLISLALLPALKLRRVLAVGIVAAAFSAVVMLPAFFFGAGSFLLPVKVFMTVCAVNILAQTTRQTKLLAALKIFRMPDIFIFVLDITVKYILLLGEFTLEMLYALRLRAVGRGKNKTAKLSGVAGTMFLKSREMAEEMHAAMQCRGA